MLKNKKIVILITIAALIFTLLGCSNVDDSVNDDADDKEAVQLNNEDVEAGENNEETQPVKILDMAGREVSLPQQINKVYGVNNNSTFLLYTLIPERMIGWNIKLADHTKQFIPEKYQKYPVLGSIYGNSKMANPEEILNYSPDVIVVTDSKITEKTKEAAEDFEKRLNVPVIVVEANITNYDKAYEFLGKVFNETEKAQRLGTYSKKTYEYAKEKSALIDQKVKVYYAREDNGLTTDVKGSPHAEVLDLVGGENVAVLNKDSQGSGKGSGEGKSVTVSIEQLLTWNPEVIIVGHSGSRKTTALETIKNEETWAAIDAVKNDKVYTIPYSPFNWFDRPPSVNRIIGVKWLGNILYPEIYDIDMKQEVKEFFNLFYNYDLSEEEIKTLLQQ